MSKTNDTDVGREALKILRRAVPWLARAYVEKIHEPCAAPNDLPNCLAQAEALLLEATRYGGHDGRLRRDVRPRVYFRVDEEGDAFALFPDHNADEEGDFCDSYQQVGQHCGADFRACMTASREATPKEYASLKAELEGPCDYGPVDVQRDAT